jgi:putative Holliday junction resolvase
LKNELKKSILTFYFRILSVEICVICGQIPDFICVHRRHLRMIFPPNLVCAISGSIKEGCMPRVLGLDFGTKRVGAALSDPRGLIATPLEVYERRDPAQDARHYQALVREHDVERIVIGLPLHTGGREGTSAALARAWGDWLAGVTGLPVVYFDERYSTVEAEDALIASGLKRQKRKGLRDMLAARIFLQDYLDAGSPTTEAAAAPLSDPIEDAP